ncbi:MAG: phage tail sheath subtilisin-like domain-containing protein [Planctomycetota bacterium]
MPSALTFPGVYIEEISSGVRPIIGVATSITAFIGRTTRGPTNEPLRVNNFGEFERRFGGIDYHCPLTYSVRQFFLNGGTDAVIVRVANEGSAFKAAGIVNSLPLRARGEGEWGDNIQVRIDHQTRSISSPQREFNLFIRDRATQAVETFRNLSLDPQDPKYFVTVLEQDSALVESDPGQSLPTAVPGEHAEITDPTVNPWETDGFFSLLAGGKNGDDLEDSDVAGKPVKKTGIYALEKLDLFNILCIPPLTKKSFENSAALYGEAAAYCTKRRAILIVDPSGDKTTVEDGEKIATSDLFNSTAANRKNMAIFFPWIKAADPVRDNRLDKFAPSGAVAGIMARTDLTRGVWKSPAGIEAGLVGVNDFTFNMTNEENGRLNILGINCLRNFRGVGNVVWGSRTLDGGDRLGSEWKYLAVRRFTLFLEESLYRGTQWVVFEPNDEPLWAQIRLNVGAFMQNLFRQGAFQGRSPREAYFVRCGSDTTTQNDINRGIVNIEVGFAPLKPAEFVVIKFQQITGKIDT